MSKKNNSAVFNICKLGREKMKINSIQNSNSFKGYINSQSLSNTLDSYITQIDEKNEKLNKTIKLQERYTRQLKGLTQNYLSALKFDTFMRDKEVKQAVDRMPEDADIIEIVHPDSSGEGNVFALFSTKVYKSIGSDDKNFAYYANCHNEDNSIDKEGILAWLNEIADYFDTLKRADVNKD